MIRWLEELPQQEDFWSELEKACPAEAAMIWAEQAVLGYGNAGLWMQEGENGPEGILLRNTMGGVTAALLPTADARELSQFLQVAGFASITLPNGWAERLNLPNTTQQEYLLMEWCEKLAALPYGYFPKEITPRRLMENTLAAFGPVVGEADQQEWEWAFGLRIRRGKALAMGLFQREELLAAAAVSHIGRTGALIGFVGTPPEKRGNGYGKTLASLMAAQIAEKGQKAMLCCRPQLEELYRTVGFAVVGRQTVLQAI